jgi:hypothetical protein
MVACKRLPKPFAAPTCQEEWRHIRYVGVRVYIIMARADTELFQPFCQNCLVISSHIIYRRQHTKRPHKKKSILLGVAIPFKIEIHI